ncbi:triacylglycerol lipase [Synechococcus sp. PCC 7336]|uniref:esterase/lipase family protein n=1 Tax=Synechococcus sp. PCC 7336 TaxID=195250 RepID=UPI00034C9465|nr:alpha/beta fold hydrolase [Synechococcus sp. PCC 7336]
MSLPTVILPGFFASAEEYLPLQQALAAEGHPTRTVPLTLRSWLPTLGGRPMTPILEALQATIAATQQEFNAPQVNLIGHSAGGWIARIYLGSEPYCDRLWAGLPNVASLITLGTPHLSQERWTRWNLDFVNTTYPGAFHPELKYVCVAGRSTLGRKAPWWQPHNWNGAEWLAYSSYQLTAGNGNLWGDGITPITAAHLDGATNLTIAGAYHSPRGDRFWYGSPEARRQWLQYLQ